MSEDLVLRKDEKVAWRWVVPGVSMGVEEWFPWENPVG